MTNYDNRKKEIGQRIKKERLALGLSPTDFLTKIYKSPSSRKSLTAWERGKTLPDLDSLSRMAELFQCDVAYLLCDYDERTRDIADAKTITGLSSKAIEILINLNNSTAYTRKFQQDLISYFLSSDIFWKETINHIQSAYQLQKGATNEIDNEHDRKVAEESAEVLKIFNQGGYTKYIVWDGSFSAEMQIRFAANSTERLFSSIVNHILKLEQGGNENG